MKIRKAEYLTMTEIANRVRCKPDALKIIEAIERLKKRAAKNRTKPR